MRYLVCSILVLFLGTANAEIYKWQNAAGQIGYGNVPPKGNTSVIEFIPKKTNTSAISEVVKNDDHITSEEREKKIAADMEKDKEIAVQNCNKSKEALQTLESGIRVVRYNAKGDKEILDDKARAIEMTRAKTSISDWCTK